MHAENGMDKDDPYDLAIHNSHAFACVDEALLRRCIREALRRCGAVGAELSLAVVDDACMAALHQRYLGVAGPTDVLSFNLASAVARESNPNHIEGEIVVCADRAVHCAGERGHPAAAELALYAVHGTLHLLGYDDKVERSAAEMHRLEDDILSACGAGRIYQA